MDCRYCKNEMASFQSCLIMEGEVDFYCSFDCFRNEMIKMLMDDMGEMLYLGIEQWLSRKERTTKADVKPQVSENRSNEKITLTRCVSCGLVPCECTYGEDR